MRVQHLPIQFNAKPYVMPEGIDTKRTFDDPRIAVEAHARMIVRFDDDARHTEQYEG